MTFNISADYSGKTVLSFIKSVLKISNSALAGLKRDPIGILVNGNHVTVRYVLKENDILFINERDSSDEENESVLPIPIPINMIFENDDVMLITNDGTVIRTPVSGISVYGRTAAGVIVMRLSEGASIVNFAKVQKEEEAEIEETNASEE